MPEAPVELAGGGGMAFPLPLSWETASGDFLLSA